MCTKAFSILAPEWKDFKVSGKIAMETHQSIAKGVQNISQALGDEV